MNTNQNRNYKRNVRTLMRLALILSAAFVMVLMMSAVSFADDKEVTYIDASGKAQERVCEKLTSGKFGWGEENGTAWYYVEDNTEFSGQRVEVYGEVNLVLLDYSTTKADQGIRVSNNSALKIYGQHKTTEEDFHNSGSLVADASGADGASGIGSNKNGQDSGECSIIINGGKITATGSKYGAGIGGGDENGFKEIYINDGEVDATGGEYGAGIGTGDKANNEDGRIYIQGGRVTAHGGSNAAGIGGSRWDGCNVQITGGSVESHGGKYGAGIGGGDEGAGDVLIRDADVKAYGGENAAGIGGGDKNSCESIFIDGAPENTRIKAVGGYNAAGIGGGSTAYGGSIVINNGTVDAKGGKFGAGIGGGYDGDAGYIAIRGGDVTAESGLAEPVDSWLHSSTGGAGIGGGSKGHAGEIWITDGKVYARGGARGAGIGTGGECSGSISESDDNEIAGNIHISGGSITADSRGNETDGSIEYSDGGAGIGSGAKSYGVNIEITGGDITAYASFYSYDDTYKNPSAAIGNGYDSDEDKLGKVSIKETHEDDPQLRITAVKWPYHAMPGFSGNVSLDYRYGCVSAGYGIKAPADKRLEWMKSTDNDKTYEAGEIVLEPCDHSESVYETTENGHTKTCSCCEYDVSNEPHDFEYYILNDSEHKEKCRICGYEKGPVKHGFNRYTGKCDCGYQWMKVTLKPGKGSGAEASEWIVKGGTYKLPTAEEADYTAPDNTELIGWKADGSDELIKAGSSKTINSDIVFTAEYGTSWRTLRTRINGASDGSTIELNNDIEALSSDGHIVIPEGKSITIDLNGHSIDRLGNMAGSGAGDDEKDVFLVNGSLTITDSSGSKGVISGGCTASDRAGGAFTVADGGSFTLQGGTITDNSAKKGGAILIKGGSFDMQGGTITGNSASEGGLAVYVESGQFTMSGGEIARNTGSGNSDTGAVQFASGADTGFSVSGSAGIYGNIVTSTSDDVSVYYARDIFLSSGQLISISNYLDESALIGVATEVQPGESDPVKIVDNAKGFDLSADNFSSNNSEYVVDVNNQKEAFIKLPDEDLPAAHSVRVVSNNDIYGAAAGDRQTARTGEKINLTAEANEGYSFKEWQSSEAEISNESVDATGIARAVATMGSGDAEITAVFEPVPVSSVSIMRGEGDTATEISSLEMTTGQEVQLSASVRPDNALDKNISWSSSDTAVAAVDNTGKITAVSGGTATITAVSNNGKKATCKVNVTGCKVCFDSGDGATIIADQIVNEGGIVTRPQDPKKDGYAFLGWKKVKADESLDEDYYDFSKPVESNMTLRAIWKHVKHDKTTLRKTEATNMNNCELAGNSEYWTCSECGRYFERIAGEGEQEAFVEIAENSWVRPAGSHVWSSWEEITGNYEKHQKKCLRCSRLETEDHEWSETGVISRPPTRTETGIIKKTCEKCGCTKDEDLPVISGNEHIITATATGNPTGISPVISLSAAAGNKGDKISIKAVPGAAGLSFIGWSIGTDNIAEIEEPTKSSTRVIILEDGDGIVALRAQFGYLVRSVILDKTSLELKEGNTAALSATVKPDNAGNKQIGWSSSDTAVATVDENGKVTAVAPGTARITAKAKDGSNRSAMCIVTVSNKDADPEPSPSPSDSEADKKAADQRNADEIAAQKAEAERLEWEGTVSSGIPAVKGIKVKAARKKIKVSWKKLKKSKLRKFDRVEIQVCTDKSFRKENTKRVEVRKSRKSATVKRLAKKKTYYVRFRNVKGRGASKMVSRWSKVRKVKTKK